MGKGEWITGQELIGLWQIQDFELISYLKKGLQAYTKYGKKIVDADNFELKPKYKSIAEAITWLKVEENRLRMIDAGHLPGRGSFHRPLNDREIEDRAKELFKEKVKVYPKADIIKNFSLPTDEREAQKMIDEAKDYRFKLSVAKVFMKKQGSDWEEDADLDLGQHKLTEVSQDTEKPEDAPKTSFSEDYRAAVRDGRTFSLSTTQASIMQVLQEAAGQGNGYLSQATVLVKIESKAKNLRSLFRRNLEAWRALIEANPNAQGLFRLKK